MVIRNVQFKKICTPSPQTVNGNSKVGSWERGGEDANANFFFFKEK